MSVLGATKLKVSALRESRLPVIAKQIMPLTNYITVDNPNVPVFSDGKPGNIEFGKFTETLVEHSSDASIRLTDMYLPNFSLRVIEAKFAGNAAFYNQRASGTDLLGSCVFFNARLKSVLPGEKEGVDVFNRTQNFKYDPNNEYLHLAPAHTPLHFVHFSYKPEYLNEMLPQNEAWAESFKEKIERRERILGAESLPITQIQEQALQNIFHCPLSGKLGELMMETSFIQFMMLQLYGHFGEGSVSQKRISQHDNNIARELKEYLTKNFLHEHSVSCLAKHFGVNTNRLMFLFRQTFGKSIFEYLGELRMQHAFKLLRDDNLRVINVARIIGYKNPNHFSAAFKKRYGVVPTELR